MEYRISINYNNKMLLDVSKNLAYNVRVERSKKSLTQEKLAELADISPKHIVMIEKAKVCPSINVVASIAKAIGVSVDKLIAEIED